MTSIEHAGARPGRKCDWLIRERRHSIRRANANGVPKRAGVKLSHRSVRNNVKIRGFSKTAGSRERWLGCRRFKRARKSYAPQVLFLAGTKPVPVSRRASVLACPANKRGRLFYVPGASLLPAN